MSISDTLMKSCCLNPPSAHTSSTHTRACRPSPRVSSSSSPIHVYWAHSPAKWYSQTHSDK
eukprot:1184080-Prorocentrum_minimum.AAC.1